MNFIVRSLKCVGMDVGEEDEERFVELRLKIWWRTANE
jgi:hypothetical protein